METGLSLTELSEWLGAQLESWREWGELQDGTWLALPTGNERHPALGDIFLHAFSPLRRYADQALGHPPPDDRELDVTDWEVLRQWARESYARHEQVINALSGEAGSKVIEYQTRSAGVLRVTATEALFHAGTHCFWHLGGIAHLLRHAGIAPPQRSDLIFWASSRRG